MRTTTQYLFLGLFLIFSFFAKAQESDPLPVAWKYKAEKISEKKFKLTFTATIAEGWKLYSVSMPDDLPNTRLQKDSASEANWQLTGLRESTTPVVSREPLFENAEVKTFSRNAEVVVEASLTGETRQLKGTIDWMAQKGDEIVGPESTPFKFTLDGTENLVGQSAELKESAEASQVLIRSSIDLERPYNQCGGTGLEGEDGKSLMGIFILGFLGGLIALLTPCVFPMIPLTVSFFTKRSPDRKQGIRNAMLYGFFIFMIYVILSIPFHLMSSVNPEILNNISTNVWLNVAFFVIFIVFALSFFGFYEITLPSSVSNMADSKAGMTSILGIFFMALTLAIVSFSCTGPILGSLLAGSLTANGGAWQLTSGMAGFGLALALPFALFALFPNWLHNLPKSGGWLNTVKITLGFIELALAIKFLSNADLVAHWGILKREVFFAAWIIIGIAMALYLFGILKFKHDDPPPKLGKFRIGIGILTTAFVLYLIPGLTNTRWANRSLISGFPPPLTYSLYGHEESKGKGVEPNVVNDYEKALKLAKAEKKPLLIDFTGWACVNCRKMEENVWTQPKVKEMIEKNFVLVSLYVDDRQPLPDEDQFIFTDKQGVKKKIRTVGDKYATLQAVNFLNASQPLYVIVNADELLLNRPIGYTPDAEEYIYWLQCGVDANKEIQ